MAKQSEWQKKFSKGFKNVDTKDSKSLSKEEARRKAVKEMMKKQYSKYSK